MEGGTVKTVVVISRNVTEQKRTELAFKKSEKMLSCFIETTNDWIWQVDSDGRYTYSSPSTENIIGYTPEELVGKTPFDFMEVDEATRIGPIFSEIVQNREDIVGLEDVMVHKDGRKIVFETNAIPVFDANGSLKGYFGTCRDITEQKIVEDERKLNEARLESLLKLHDMRQATDEELAQFTLTESERLTQSKIEFINYLSEDETMVTHAVYTPNTLRQCKLPEDVGTFKISACGLWSEAYRQRRPIIMNNYTREHATKVGFPEGHPVLQRFISIPVFRGDHVVAVAALGNKKTDYNQGDVRQFRLFIEGLWQIMQRKKVDRAPQSSF